VWIKWAGGVLSGRSFEIFKERPAGFSKPGRSGNLEVPAVLEVTSFK
jgi:hypothetical protein